VKDHDRDADSERCVPAQFAASAPEVVRHSAALEVIYVGDPMCSWCWGLAPTLREFRKHCLAQDIPFRIVVGGLRPGGGQRWNQAFRDLLRHHWEDVGRRSGQPFSYRLLARARFNYDTEPACRAIVAARPLLAGSDLEFFAAVQRRFYVDNEDPAGHAFYTDICLRFALDFAAFVARFASEAVREETLAEFRMSRLWGVRQFPSVLLRTGAQLAAITSGFTSLEHMKSNLCLMRADP
jgi:putative protein-disulfide isomerase